MTTEAVITVPFVDWESPKEDWDEDGNFSATRILRCAWEDRVTLANELRGGWFNNDEESTSIRRLPARYPDREDAFVNIVGARGWPALKGKDVLPQGEFPRFEYALLTVGYERSVREGTSWNNDESLQVKNRFEGSVEVLTKSVDENTIFWHDDKDAVQVDAAPNVIIPALRWSINIRNVRYLNSEMVQYMGAVNEETIANNYLPRGARGVWEFLPEQVRYETPDMEEVLDEDGNVRWDVTLQFSVIFGQRAYPASPETYGTWNHGFRPGRNQPERMYNDESVRTEGNIYRPYRLVDINSLLGKFL
jgi:hypothetical protein